MVLQVRREVDIDKWQDYVNHKEVRYLRPKIVERPSVEEEKPALSHVAHKLNPVEAK